MSEIEAGADVSLPPSPVVNITDAGAPTTAPDDQTGPDGPWPGSFGHAKVLPFDRRRGDRRQNDRRSTTLVRTQLRVAVLLPCRDEATTVGQVVRDFHDVLPDAQIWVFDNASTDGTAEVARAAGAHVVTEPRPGKGSVVRRMFSEVDADLYVMADGDGTYEPGAAVLMIDHLLTNHLDMVVGRRREIVTDGVYRPGHRFGNALLTGVVQYLFGQGSADMLSGYRVFTKRFVKSFPAWSRGFETETEVTVHALDLGLPFGEVDTIYSARPSDSHSKLRTIPDGFKILGFTAMLLKEFRPAAFFGSLAAVSGVVALLVRLLAWHTFSSTTAAAAVAGAFLVAMVVLILAGLILDSVSRGRREVKRMMYLGGDRPPRSGPATEQGATGSAGF